MQITIREPGSAITHFIAMMMAVFAAVPLLVKAGVQSGQENFLAMAIFGHFHGQHDPVIRCQRHLSFRGPHR